MQQQINNLEVEKAHLEAANGAASEERSKEIELLNVQNELSSVRGQLQHKEAQYAADISEIRKLLGNAENEVKIQKEKNDVSETYFHSCTVQCKIIVDLFALGVA